MDLLPLDAEFAVTPAQLIVRGALVVNDLTRDERVRFLWTRLDALLDRTVGDSPRAQAAMRQIVQTPVAERLASASVQQAVTQVLDALDPLEAARLATLGCADLGWHARWLALMLVRLYLHQRRAQICGLIAVDITADLWREMRAAQARYDADQVKEPKPKNDAAHLARYAHWVYAIDFCDPPATIGALGRQYLIDFPGPRQEDNDGRAAVKYGLKKARSHLALRRVPRP